MTKIYAAKGRYPFRSKAQTICGSTFYGTVSNLFVIDNKPPAAKITAISFLQKEAHTGSKKGIKQNEPFSYLAAAHTKSANFSTASLLPICKQENWYLSDTEL